MTTATGPLAGVKIVEFAGIGPGPFCTMLMSDMGAEVIRIDRMGSQGSMKHDVMARGRRVVAIDLKKPEGVETALKLIDEADGLIEGFRPGVMERLGLGPDVCMARNPKLVFGRMTGWGQFGPMASAAGHDINYISLTGALWSIGRKGEKPVPPLNLVGDFGGGAMFLAFGMACALFEAAGSGKGQVVDAAMTDGSALLMAIIYGLKNAGAWQNERGANLLDTGAHFYDTFETKDGKYISLGSIEPQFYALLLEKAEITDPEFKKQNDRQEWPALKEKLVGIMKTKTRDEWCEIMEGTDICFAPILDLEEAPKHPHNVARETFVDIDGFVQPNVAPRFSRTKPQVQTPPAGDGLHTDEALTAWGFSADEVAKLKDAGAI